MNERNHNESFLLVEQNSPVHNILWAAVQDYETFRRERLILLGDVVRQNNLEQFGITALDLHLVGERNMGDPIIGVTVTGSEELMLRLKESFAQDFTFEDYIGRELHGIWKPGSHVTKTATDIFKGWEYGTRRGGEFFYNATVEAYNLLNADNPAVIAGFKAGQDFDADCFLNALPAMFRPIDGDRVLVMVHQVRVSNWFKLIQGLNLTPITSWEAFRLAADSDEAEAKISNMSTGNRASEVLTASTK